MNHCTSKNHKYITNSGLVILHVKVSELGRFTVLQIKKTSILKTHYFTIFLDQLTIILHIKSLRFNIQVYMK